MDIKKEYGTDASLETEGTWEDFGEGCEIKIARIGNKAYRKYFQKASKPYQKQIRRGTLSDDKAEELLIDAMAHCIVMDWKGMQEDGADIEFSIANCKRVLTEYKDLRDAISDIANSAESFKLAEDEAAEKNSENS